jgi:hypothetical protein
LVIARSELKLIVVLSVAELLVVGESVTPAGAVTVAVFESVPVAEEATVPVAVKVALLVVGRLTVVEMFPAPEAAAQLPPTDEQVQVTPVNVAGKVSLTAAFTTSDGPLFVTTIV